MRFFFPYFVLIVLLIQFFLRKNTKKNAHANEDFWNREQKANLVRRKDLSSLSYITIPEDFSIPETADAAITKEWATITRLKEKKIVNFSGKTNTDLKLEYGMPNLSILTEYDNNYIQLCRSLASLGTRLMEQGYEAQAVPFLEYGISIGTDIKANYVELARYYIRTGEAEQVLHLITKAEQLPSLMRDSIVTTLKNL